MISERTRDKMNAARRRGKWVGGAVVLGYDLVPGGGALVVNAEEAERVREIYRLYLEFGSLIPLVQELDRRGWRLKSRLTREGKRVGGSPFNKTKLHNLLTSVIYTGRVKHQGEIYSGEQERIVDDATWNAVQERLNRNAQRGGRNVRNKHGALLKALVRCGGCGVKMTHTYVQKKGKIRYRYYVCENARQKGWTRCETRSVSAPALEGAVLQQLRSISENPAVLSEVLGQLERQRQETGRNTPMADTDEVKEALARFDPLWEHFTSWERESFIRTLVSGVRFDGRTSKVTVAFRSEALKQLCNVNIESARDGNV